MHQPAIRPPQYPVEVLWTAEDCQADRDVKVSASNRSRPPMDKAVRTADGRMVTKGEWRAIKATARMIITTELTKLPVPTNSVARKGERTKTWYKTHYPIEWNAAIMQMEAQQPLLALCAAHWKADQILGMQILTMLDASKKKKHKKKKNDLPDSDSDSDDPPRSIRADGLDDGVKSTGEGSPSKASTSARSAVESTLNKRRRNSNPHLGPRKRNNVGSETKSDEGRF